MLKRIIESIFSKTYTVQCPDGTTRTLHKKVDDAFPLHVAGWEKSVIAKIKASEEVNGELELKSAGKIEGLFIAIDELNNTIMMEFRAAYIAFQGNPCGSYEFFQRSVEKISDRRNQIARLKIQVSALIEMAKTAPDSVEFNQIFGEVIRRINVRDGSELTIAEIKEAENEAKRLSGEISA